MKAFLIITAGTLAGEYHTLTDGAAHTIGRSSAAAWRIDDERVSRVHCVIWVRNGEVFVRDLGSRNGTFINDEPLESGSAEDISAPAPGDYPWKPGEELRIGSLQFQLVLEEQPDAERPALKIKVRGGRHPDGSKKVEVVSAEVEAPKPVVRPSETVQYIPPSIPVGTSHDVLNDTGEFSAYTPHK